MSYMKLWVPANLVSFLTFSFKYIYGELVELYLLSRLSTVIDESSVGLYTLYTVFSLMCVGKLLLGQNCLTNMLIFG